MVTVEDPVAVGLAVSVKALVAVAGFVPNAAVTPLGMPDADKVTFPVKPFWGAMLMVPEPLIP